MPDISTIRDLAAAFVLLLTVPAVLELLLTTLGNLLVRRRAPSDPGILRLVVLIPAHNEEHNIRRCVESALAACSRCAAAKVIVIADNCTDGTASAAIEAGAHVMERCQPLRRGKANALADVLGMLELEAFDAYFVLDADSVVSGNCVEAALTRFAAGANAVQCRNLVLNAEQSPRTRLLSLALYAFNVLRPRGRMGWGLSAGPFGNGFAFTRQTLRMAPYQAATIVEDLEYHLALLMAGGKAAFADEATVWSVVPSTSAGAGPQRCRWEGGRLRVALLWAPVLFRNLLRGRWRLLEPLLELLTPPLGFLLLAVLTGLVIGSATLLRAYAVAALFVIAAHVAAAAMLMEKPWRAIRALALAPWYVLWKIRMLPGLLRASRPTAGWSSHT